MQLYQTNAEIRAAVEAASDSNVFTDADHTKLRTMIIEDGATADQTITEIKSLIAGSPLMLVILQQTQLIQVNWQMTLLQMPNCRCRTKNFGNYAIWYSF